jgi:hypothetical protein
MSIDLLLDVKERESEGGKNSSQPIVTELYVPFYASFLMIGFHCMVLPSSLTLVPPSNDSIKSVKYGFAYSIKLLGN